MAVGEFVLFSDRFAEDLSEGERERERKRKKTMKKKETMNRKRYKNQ